jgi:hypothetical protein
MALTISGTIDKVKQYVRNQNLTDSRVISSINSALRYLKSVINVPNYVREYKIDYIDDIHLYNLPNDVGELLSVRYEDDEFNKYGMWKRKPAEYLFKRFETQSFNTRLFGWYNGNGLNQIVLIGKNRNPSILIDGFDYNNSSRWTASDDATNIVDNTINYKNGGCSLSFDIDVSLSGLNRATLTRNVNNLDLSRFYEAGSFLLWVYLPNITGFSSITLNVGSSLSNYFKIVSTTQYDGSPFSIGWQLVKFKFSDSIKIGSPNISSINKIWLNFDYSSSYVSTNGVKLDLLKLYIPETLIVNYQTSYIGTDSSNNDIYSFSSSTDKYYFNNYSAEFEELIALQAAVILSPQILVDMKEIKQFYNSLFASLSMRYPKVRSNNLLFEPDISKTSFD